MIKKVILFSMLSSFTFPIYTQTFFEKISSNAQSLYSKYNKQILGLTICVSVYKIYKLYKENKSLKRQIWVKEYFSVNTFDKEVQTDFSGL